MIHLQSLQMKLLESDLYLRLEQVGFVSVMAVAVSVLHLQAAFGVEPPLQSGYVIGLLVFCVFVLIEKVVGRYQVKFGQ